MVVFGYSSSVVYALASVLVATTLARAACSVFETVIVARMKDQINAGSFSAYTNAIASFGAAAAPLIMGKSILQGWTFTYTLILIESIALIILIAGFTFFTKRTKAR